MHNCTNCEKKTFSFLPETASAFIQLRLYGSAFAISSCNEQFTPVPGPVVLALQQNMPEKTLVSDFFCKAYDASQLTPPSSRPSQAAGLGIRNAVGLASGLHSEHRVVDMDKKVSGWKNCDPRCVALAHEEPSLPPRARERRGDSIGDIRLRSSSL